MSAPAAVSFTGTLLALGQLREMEVDIKEGLAFAANVFNIRAAAGAFKTERTFHAGPVYDAAPELLERLDYLVKFIEAGGTPDAEDLAPASAVIRKARGTP